MMAEQSFFSRGKLLITSEYFVLDGATALALPTKTGQNMSVSKRNDNTILWKSFDNLGNIWFQAHLDSNYQILDTTDTEIAQVLIKILKKAFEKAALFGHDIQTHLDFNRSWGLGTSSTLIYNIAQWTNSDPYKLLEVSFGGSGYDIACAQSKGPLLFQKTPEPTFKNVVFDPSFKESIFFIYLNKKQNSRESISHYKSINLSLKNDLIRQLSDITDRIINAKSIETFINLMSKHEDIISSSLKLTKVKDLYFNDFDGNIKSLGGWGGDFVMAASTNDNKYVRNYFKQKGFETILNFNDII